MDLILTNLTSPMIGCFLLGVLATLIKSDLKLPDGLYQTLSIYLLLAIGLKGGVELQASSPSEWGGPLVATVALGIATPFVMYVVALWFGRLDRKNAAALAAHYGSVSAVTFIAAVSFAEAGEIATEGFMPALVAVLEIPAIVIGLFLARSENSSSRKEGLREVLSGKSILLLAGGVLVGLAAGKAGYAQVKPFFTDGFRGALCLFLLDMGLVASRRFRDITTNRVFILLAGIFVPIVNGLLGVWVGSLAGLSIGGAAVLGCMTASASYIAAPAAVRAAIPEANPGLYLTASLGVTFPFNISIGIPMFFLFSNWLHTGG